MYSKNDLNSGLHHFVVSYFAVRAVLAAVIAFIVIGTVASLNIGLRNTSQLSLSSFTSAVRNNIYPKRGYHQDGCKIVNFSSSQPETYLIQGSTANGDQTVSFWCDYGGYLDEIRYTKVNIQDITLRTVSDPQTGRYAIGYMGCPSATDYALRLPWNQTRCQAQVVTQSLDIPASEFK